MAIAQAWNKPNGFTLEQTRDWWRLTMADPARFEAWLQKLYVTELSGYTDHLAYLAKQGSIDMKPAQTLLHIALDELKHSDILSNLMYHRGIARGTPPKSTYWATMNHAVQNLDQYCAVNYFGEELAAVRFEIIHEMPETPSDLKEALGAILPDEIFHRITLEKLAGVDAIEQMRETHERALATLRT